ncbi:hypothetical protein A5844_002043 [Enterococcus sp. 10A9_DIV0425]|uniref:Uncharacterized protein n=1 Tax=Candidatus Enterococcus wittei TaxID=1987383 RepID=A0A242K059_9ENTE|nr:hypothetical protein [Enterococcus sp. 10A9_DIV0425]OTP10343.1 hypothetical protein A5844_002043 [Enterococcus sp. 10A9_DIV0425]
MPKLPQDAYREKIGNNNNKRNDEHPSGTDQKVLTYMANHNGLTATRNGVWTFTGLVQLLSILQNLHLPDPPEQHPVVEKDSPAFEVTTRIDVRRDGNQTRIHSFVSTSTINPARIQSLNTTMPQQSTSIALPFVSTSPFFGNQTFYNQTTTATATQQDIDVAKITHELSFSVHQSAHEIYQALKCYTTRRTDQVNTYIIAGVSVEQTRLTTICQDAVGRSNAQNEQGMKQESEHAPLSSQHMNNPVHFSAEEAAQKLSKAFQAAYENKQNATEDEPTNVHNQVTGTFWNGLTEQFYQFFSQHAHTSYTQKQDGGSEETLFSHIVDWFLRAFSVNYGEPIPPIPIPQSEKNRQVPVNIHPMDHSLPTKTSKKEAKNEKQVSNHQEPPPEATSEAAAVSNPEEESFLAQFWDMAVDIIERVDGYIQYFNFNVFPHLGAEARPIPVGIETTVENNPIHVTTTPSEATELNVTQAGEIATTQEINQKIQAFLRENRADLTKAVVQEEQEIPLPTWNREQKENIRKKLVDFFMENGIACQESNAKDLIETVGEWVLLEDAVPVTLDMVKVKQIAKLLLGMNEETVISEEQASLTVGTWVYETIKDNQPVALALVAEMTKQPEGTSTPSTTSSPQSTSVDKRKNKVVETDGIQWRDPEVRKQVEAFFQQKKLLSDQPTKEEVLIAMGKRITQEKNNTLVFNHKRLQPLAKVILKALKLNDEKNKENLSNKDAELTIMKWAFETILGSSLEAYMVKILVSAPDVDQFTIGRLRDLFTVRNLEKEGLIQLDTPTLSQKQKRFFNRLWNFLLQKELPNYFLDSSGLADNLLISDYASLMQLTGVKILKEGGYLESFSSEDSRLMGQHFWENILEKGITIYEEFRHLLMPSLLAVAQLEPDLLREALATGTYKEVAISTFIGYQKEGYYKIIENQEILDRLYKAYQKNFLQWRRKEALATALAQTCRDKGSLTSFDVIKQNYLIGAADPCPDIDWLPTKLETRYTKLTKNVAEAYLPLDKKLIEFALPAFDKEERAFIFSEGTHLYEANAELKNESDYIEEMPVTSGSPAIHFLLSVRKKKTTTLSLNKTDLFVAVNGKEERWYALKQLDGEGGYRFYRVNQDPLLYLKLGLFDQKNLWKNGYKKEGNEIRIGDKLFTFSTHVNRNKKLSHGIETAPFIEVLSRKHSDQLYQQLYDSGNDKADLKKAWEVTKHFIPFYDCVTGIINQDTEEAVVSCTIDALLMIPILGQVTSLNMKFALGVARAFVRGGIRNVIRSSRSFLPTMAEIRRLVLTFAQNLDPGFEPLIGGGRLIVRKLVKFKNELHVGKKIKDLLERVEKLEKAQEALKKSIEMLEWKGLEVPVKKVNEHLYMRVTNLETAEVFGGLFMKKGNRIEAYRPATFTTEQLNLIDLLKVKLDKDQVFVVEVNSNPQAYGTGEITTVKKEGEETKRFIRMKGKLIEVSMTIIKEHGFRLDVYARHAGKIMPVNFNGVEWYFEAPTSPFISKSVEEKIARELDKFETRKNPSDLSAPDGKGLMWEESGRSHIKINDHYIPLIALDKKDNRYHLVKKDSNEPMTILRFDEKKGKFRFETDLERAKVEAIEKTNKKEKSPKLKVLQHKRKLKKQDITSGTSKVSQGETPGTSGTSRVSQGETAGTSSTKKKRVNRSKMGTLVGQVKKNDIPKSAGKRDLWSKLREAELYKYVVPRIEDPNVRLAPLTEFVSDLPNKYHFSDKEIRRNILKTIKEHLPPNSTFNTMAGVKPDKVPDFLKLFIQDIEYGLEQLTKFTDSGIAIFEKLLLDKTTAKAELNKAVANAVVDNAVAQAVVDDAVVKVQLAESTLDQAIAKAELKEAMAKAEHAQFELDKAVELVKFDKTLSQSKVGEYLTKLLSINETPSQELLITETIKRLLHRLKKIKDFYKQSKQRDYENILFVWSDLFVKKEGENGYVSTVDLAIPKAEVFPTDGECRVIIYADSHHLDPQKAPDYELTARPSRVLIHEGSHLVSHTEDLAVQYYPPRGTELTAAQAITRLYEEFNNIVNLDSQPFSIFVDHLAKELNLPNLSKSEVLRVMCEDDLLIYNFLLTDAELSTLILRDIIEGRGINEIVRVPRSTDNQKMKLKFLFLYTAMAYLFRNSNLEVNLQLNQMKEQDTTKVTDNVSTDIPSKEIMEETRMIGHTESLKNLKYRAKDRLKKEVSDLITTSMTKSNNSTTEFIMKEQGVTSPTQSPSTLSFSDLVTRSIEKRNKLRQNVSKKQTHNRQEATPQY